PHRDLPSFPTRRSSDLGLIYPHQQVINGADHALCFGLERGDGLTQDADGHRHDLKRMQDDGDVLNLERRIQPWACERSECGSSRSEEHTSELQSLAYLV